MKTAKLRKWGTVIVTAATLHHGGGDPLSAAIDYHEHVTSRADVAERVISITAPSRSARSATPALLLTIKHHESRGNYQAVNPTGCDGLPCGGAYQLHISYASQWAADAGYPGLSPRAETWPPATQDAVALHLYWSTATPGYHWCRWTDYC